MYICAYIMIHYIVILSYIMLRVVISSAALRFKTAAIEERGEDLSRASRLPQPHLRSAKVTHFSSEATRPRCVCDSGHAPIQIRFRSPAWPVPQRSRPKRSALASTVTDCCLNAEVRVRSRVHKLSSRL